MSWAPDNRLIVQGALARRSSTKLGVEFGVFFTGLDAVPAGAKPIRAPRVALYRSYRANMDEGWTRWMLEQYEFRVHDAVERRSAHRRSVEVRRAAVRG